MSSSLLDIDKQDDRIRTVLDMCNSEVLCDVTLAVNCKQGVLIMLAPVFGRVLTYTKLIDRHIIAMASRSEAECVSKVKQPRSDFSRRTAPNYNSQSNH